MSNTKLYSFSEYQLNTDIALGGSAELVPTIYGQGVSLNSFGPRFASVKLPNNYNCFSKINECRKGITIKLSLRVDYVTMLRQTFVSSPQLVVGSDLGRLFIHLFSSDRSWFYTGREILQSFSWQLMVISWRLDNGMKIFINGIFMDHITTSTEIQQQDLYFKSVLHFGYDPLKRTSDYATILIDDLEFFEADGNNLAYESHFRNRNFGYFHIYNGNLL